MEEALNGDMLPVAAIEECEEQSQQHHNGGRRQAPVEHPPPRRCHGGILGDGSLRSGTGAAYRKKCGGPGPPHLVERET
jgi:hypothetical protein